MEAGSVSPSPRGRGRNVRSVLNEPGAGLAGWLALGATAVGIGRPYVWGLSCFGEQGVDRVLEMLNNELRLAMVGCGARSVMEISAASLIDARGR